MTALVDGPNHTTSCEIEITASAAQYWRQGDHQAALRKELREAWLEELYYSRDTLSAAYHYQQMLEALKQQHPNRIALLDSIKQRVEQNWQRPLRESQSAQREALAQEPPFEGAWDKIKGIFKPAHRAPSPDPWPRSDAKKSVESDQTASPLVWT
ncbi:MAG: hypothetical protein ACRERS_03950, partial [Methylococcales bacterium]